jgi:adenylosuccinate synthase
LKYIQKLNGLTSINITKLDVLSGLKEIKIATKYTVDGKEISHMPADIEELESVKCVFETFKG